jgi:2-oxoglutarate ferredoxin oxidoreductase subunit delta
MGQGARREVNLLICKHVNLINMSKMKGAIVVNTDRCKGCQLCIVACPQDVIALAQKKVNVHGYPYVEPANADKCVGCASCAVVCPDGCITVYRKKVEE